MMKTVLLIAAGGAAGATLRHFWAVLVHRLAGGPTEFPIAIMGANVLGSFLMGVFVVVAAQKGLTHASPFVMTGLLGGFTTFSAFSLEAVTLIERGELWQAALYMVLSVVLSVLGLFAGLWVMRGVLL